MRLLVVDDNADLRDGLAEWLGADGACVATAGGGSEAMRTFSHDPPDVLVSDLCMPEGSGYDLIREVRALPPERGGLVPAIALSAAENLRAALMAGFHVFLAKPCDWSKLVETIAELGRPADGEQACAPWTITQGRRPEQVVVTFVGRVHAGDMRAMTAALRVHLDRGPIEIVSDLRRLTGFSPSAPNVAERTVWPGRRNIKAVRIVGGSFAARLVSAASCKVLGIPWSFCDTPDDASSEPL